MRLISNERTAKWAFPVTRHYVLPLFVLLVTTSIWFFKRFLYLNSSRLIICLKQPRDGWYLYQLVTKRRLEEHLSRENALSSEKFLFVGILSGSSHSFHQRRNAARETWLQWTNDLPMGYKFFIEIPLDKTDRHGLIQEIIATRDIELMQYVDDNLSKWHFKAMWIIQYGVARGYQYIIRTDDDSFWCMHKLYYNLIFLPKEGLLMAHYFNNHTDVQFLISRDAGIEYLSEADLGFQNVVWTNVNFGLPRTIQIHVCNNPQMAFGKHLAFGNLYEDGWVGLEELNDYQLNKFCQKYVASHQVTPKAMKSLYRKTVDWISFGYGHILCTIEPPECNRNVSLPF